MKYRDSLSGLPSCVFVAHTAIGWTPLHLLLRRTMLRDASQL